MPSSTDKPPFESILLTPRLLLQLHYKTNDAQTDDLVTCLNDPVVMAVGRDVRIGSREECIEGGLHVGLPLHVRGPHNEDGPCNYIVYLRSNDQGTQKPGPLIGIINLLQPQKDVPPQIGWATLHAQSGKGYATEAAKEALRYWRDEFGQREIAAVISPTNTASEGIARKLGMEIGGTVEGEERKVWVPKDMRKLEQQEVERLFN